MNILLLSAYDAASHKRWRLGLANAFPQHNFTQLTLPARHFNWRIRGNALSWAFNQRQQLEQEWDLLIATSTVDVASLVALVPQLQTVPKVLYFHENQCAYPRSINQQASIEPLMVSIYAAASSDVLCFNSDFNRQSFLAGTDALMAQLPDEIPDGLVQTLRNKSRVLPVPLENTLFARNERSSGSSMSNADRLQIVWNHRWEYDKGPERLLAVIEALPKSLMLTWHILGQRFRRQLPVFDEIYTCLQQRGWLGQWGFIASDELYRQCLSRAHLVLSTSLHDFQGLSVLEAVALGAIPVVPQRLSYQELFDERFLYASEFTNEQLALSFLSRQGAAGGVDARDETLSCVHMIQRYCVAGAKSHRDTFAADVAPDTTWLSWNSLWDRYDDLLGEVASLKK